MLFKRSTKIMTATTAGRPNMAIVKIKYAPSYIFVMGKEGADKVRKTLVEYPNFYGKESKLFVVEGTGKKAAEEVFDLTNNPARDNERDIVYGNGPSLSSGDIVVVGTEQWLCCAMGWELL